MRHAWIALLPAAGTFAMAQTPRFEQIQQVLNERCVACHAGAGAQGKLRLDTPEGIATVVIPGSSGSSKLLQRAESTDSTLRMPPAGTPLSSEQLANLRSWIDAGAPGLPSTKIDVGKVDFVRHVEPLLKKNCIGCHGGAQPKGQLRMDLASGLLKGGISGSVVTPGNSDTSRLIHRLEGKSGERRMPLGREGLAPREIAVLRAWIDQGARVPESALAKRDPGIEKHWAYRSPVKPELPKVRGAVNNGIDNFLLAKLEKERMGFQAEASRETLARRVSLDLTGLPPTPADLDEFLNDARPGAYERLVDRLLDSRHYGERWARPWLDLARYADTNGYEKDNRRTMWKFRDWVIGALNSDMGFDQFTIEQIAGDLLPGASVDQKIATGFHRNTMLNEEGGVDKEEAHFEVLVDRVNTTATVWLASTFACTQCHNHKYDPFTQKDYYRLMAFFNNGAREIRNYGDTSQKYLEPQLDLATPGQEEKRRTLKSEAEGIEKKLKTPSPELEAEQRGWEERVRAAGQDWERLAPRSMQSRAGAKLEAAGDAILASGANAQFETYVIEGATKLGRLSGLRLETMPHASLPRGGPGRDVYGNFILTDAKLEIAPANDPSAWRAVEFKRYLVDEGRVMDRYGMQLWKIDASREDQRLSRQMIFVPAKPVELSGDTLIRVSLVQNSEFTGQGIGHFRLSVTGAADPSLVVKVRHRLRSVLEIPATQRSKEQAEELATYFRSIAPSLEASRDRLKDLNDELARLGIATALVMQEAKSADRPFDFVRTRGAFASKGERVESDVPAALGSLPPGAPPNRLGLAQWLVSRENPLTARVAVNRIWEQYFGRGIVETSEDFGSQGTRPSHPELLDWLAAEFMDSGWKMKSLHRLIVTSKAYRQSSRVTPEVLQADPYNLLISRGPRFRMEAEMIRDSALASSGLLSRRVGGSSVFPYQPAGVWDIPYSSEKWEESEGPDRYRRGLYTFLRRSAMYPSMMNFDATSREVCTVRRIRTNTPLQALTVMNDPAYFEMAKALASRIVKEGGSSNRERLDHGFRLVAGRRATPSEADRILGWHDREREYFAAHPGEARQLGGDADRAAWTMLSNVLLNLDEALTKE